MMYVGEVGPMKSEAGSRSLGETLPRSVRNLGPSAATVLQTCGDTCS